MAESKVVAPRTLELAVYYCDAYKNAQQVAITPKTKELPFGWGEVGEWQIDFFSLDVDKKKLVYFRHGNWGKWPDEHGIALRRDNDRIQQGGWCNGECDYEWTTIYTKQQDIGKLMAFYESQEAPQSVLDFLKGQLKDLYAKYPAGAQRVDFPEQKPVYSAVID